MEFLPEEEEVTMETREDPPSHYLYKIESFSKLLEHGIEKCESEEFESGGHKWKLVLYPDGNKQKDGEGHVSAYLAIADPAAFPTNSEIKVIATFFIYNQNLDNYMTFRGKIRRFHVLKTEWGFHKLVSHKVLKEPSNGYLVDDNCAFGVEAFVIKTTGLGSCMCVRSNSFKREWKIPQFSTSGYKWISDVFTGGAHKWQAQLLPQGDRSPINQNISVYLNLVNARGSSSGGKVLVDCSFTIIDQATNEKHHSKKTDHSWYSTSSPGWGFSTFLTRNELNDPSKGLIMKDFCILEVEVTMHAVVRGLP